MPTVPPACPRCRASGQVFAWAKRRPVGAWSNPFWHLEAGNGFIRVPCPLCRGAGTLQPEPEPHSDPALWAHAPPRRE